MSEFGYVEQPILGWLAGEPRATYGGTGLGWTYRDEGAMAAYARSLEDPLVETLLVPAIVRVNAAVMTEAQARIAVSALRKTMSHPNRLTGNRETLDLLRDGAKVVLEPGADATTVHYVAYEPDRQDLNDFTATNQYRVQGVKQCREDTVLLVNGIPLVVAEYKSYIASGKDWREAVHQLHRYQRQAPALLTTNVFCVAADEEEFRYGTVLFGDASKDEVEQHLDTWGRWLSLYPERRGYWNDPDSLAPDDPLEVAVRGLLRLKPAHLLDFVQHFVVFETKRGAVSKKVARYQQFEAVNDLVDRTVSLVGQTAAAQDRTGLIWHTQGSGKSLTMIFAGQKFRRHPALNNPTVLVVVDRRDLKTQLSDDFDACDYPNVEKALGVADLKRRLRADWRGTLVTTIQAFQRMGDLAPITRDNVISMVDEAHRSQKGDGKESFAMTMRVKLANGFRYGFTGTPIDRTLQNTHRDFGPSIDREQERYLSYYGIRRAIRDGATLEVHYLRDQVPFLVDEEALNLGFEAMCEEMELEDEEAKDFVQRQRAQWKELARHRDRIDLVAERMLNHFLEHPDPNGFKAQLVAVDRKACALYKQALDIKLAERGLPPEWCDVIISGAQNSEPEIERFEYPKAKQDDLIEFFKQTPAEWEAQNRERHGEDHAKWRPPVKVLIVCDRLLTGFDAPVEQVMYLDKPLRDHNLLQAIARTNRPLPAMKKRTGVVVDYFGVFSNLEKALNFDESVREESLIDWDVLRATVPQEVARTMSTFDGIAMVDTRDSLLAALRRLREPEAARIFEQDFHSLERLWEAVAPDPVLYPHRESYNWLCGIYIAHRRRQRGTRDTYGELSAKTRQLIQENTAFLDIAESLPVFRIDEDYVAKLDQLPTPADKAAALEAALTSELSDDDPAFVYQQLGERLQRVKDRKDASDLETARRLKELEELAEEASEAKQDPDRLNLREPGEYGLFTVLRAHAVTEDEGALAECARRMVAHLRSNGLLARGWSTSIGGRLRVERSLLAESWNPSYAELGFDPDAENPAFLAPSVDELVKADG
jgi:type I restriction enzyme R subunit